MNRWHIGTFIEKKVFLKGNVADPWHIGIWIRIRGSMFLTTGSGSESGSCYFRHWPSRCQQKLIFFCFSAYFFLKVHLHHFSKKSQKEVTKQKESRFCLLFLLHDKSIRISN
jgi:hypothetical protein